MGSEFLTPVNSGKLSFIVPVQKWFQNFKVVSFVDCLVFCFFFSIRFLNRTTLLWLQSRFSYVFIAFGFYSYFVFFPASMLEKSEAICFVSIRTKTTFCPSHVCFFSFLFFFWLDTARFVRYKLGNVSSTHTHTHTQKFATRVTRCLGNAQ